MRLWWVAGLVMIALSGCMMDGAGPPLGKPPVDQAPDIEFSTDDGNDRINVTRVDSGVDWHEFVIEAPGTQHALKGGAFTSGPNVGSGPVAAGDFISLCGSDGQATNVTVRIFHPWSYTIPYVTKFATLAAC